MCSPAAAAAMSESGEMFPNKQEVKIMGKLTKEDFDSEEEISLLSFESDEDGFSIDGAQKPAAASSDTRILNHDVPSPFHFAKDRKCHAETNKHGFSSDEETNSVAHSFDHVHENPVVRPFAAPTGGGPPLAICSFKAASIEMNHQNPIVTHVQNKSISSFSAATMNEFKEIFTDEQEAKIVEKLTSEGFPFGTFDPNLDSQEEIGSWGPEDYEDGFNSDGAENPGAASSSLPASLPAPLLRKTSLPRKKNKKPAKKLLKRSEAPPDEREYIRDSLQPMDVVCGRSGKYQYVPKESPRSACKSLTSPCS